MLLKAAHDERIHMRKFFTISRKNRGEAKKKEEKKSTQHRVSAVNIKHIKFHLSSLLFSIYPLAFIRSFLRLCFVQKDKLNIIISIVI